MASTRAINCTSGRHKRGPYDIPGSFKIHSYRCVFAIYVIKILKTMNMRKKLAKYLLFSFFLSTILIAVRYLALLPILYVFSLSERSFYASRPNYSKP